MDSASKKRLAGYVFAVVAVGAIATYFMFKRPTPESAALAYADRVIEGDVEWIYDHSTNEEKATAGFTPELVNSFYSEFLSTVLDEAEIVGKPVLTPFSGTMCSAEFKIKLKTGEIVPVGVFAFVEEGQVRVGACESLLYVAANVNFRDLPDLTDRIRKGWRVYGPWFIKHGMPVMYSSQDGGVIPLKP
ncbi:MAG: hypothetical protein M3R13_01250 [Armatimonadota bacterium]|nr:hypothetical protein [Armatimonadota bacterium]